MKTTDDQNEIFDVVDESDNVIGKTTRGEVHKNKNLIHRSIGIAIYNNVGELYLQKRSETKDTDPGKWCISCSGHVNSGDNYEETAIRELEEELGIGLYKAMPCTARHCLEEVAKYICRAANETEMQMLFKTIYNGPFKLNKEEISEGKFFTRKELSKLIASGKFELSFMGKMALGKLEW